MLVCGECVLEIVYWYYKMRNRNIWIFNLDWIG